MAKVIGLSGPQGGGKTTLLNGLQAKGLYVDDFKVSREVQKQLGWEKLDNVLDEVDTMMAFQTKILNVKRERDEANRHRTDVDIILTERTFADIAAYTQLWTWELVHAGKWTVPKALDFVIEYVDTCTYFQHSYEGNMLLPFMPHIAWQADPHRAQLEHVDFIVEQLEAFFRAKNPASVPVFRITEGTIQGRIDQAYSWIKHEC